MDELGYRDEVYARVRKQAGQDAILQHVGRYQRSRALAERARKLPSPKQRHVALIYATGPIRRGRSGRGPLSGGAMGSDTISAALRAAVADDDARAIVLRVNSPGGSYVASDTIWREVVRARSAGKPVVVSMGDVAASGGYFISMAADAIVAQPGTVTGSIGVLTGKPVLSDLLGRAGVTTDSVAEGAHSEMFKTTRPFTEDEWALVNDWLDHIYADFTGKVAEGRRMTAERVHELARGRVWTGADALDNGLVDELGGLDRAAAIARRRAGLPAAAPLRIYPRVTPLDRLRPARARPAPPCCPPPSRTRHAPGHGGAARRGLGAGLAAGHPGRPVAVRAADPPRELDIRLTQRMAAGSRPAIADVLAAFASGVTLVTVADGRDDIGTTVTAFCPVSGDPPLVLVSLIASSYPAELLGRLDRFAVTVLAAGQRALAGRFAASGRPGARLLLDGVPHQRGALSGALIPADGLAALECEVTQRVEAGDHLLVIARVLDVAYLAEGGQPLIRFRGKYPPLA